MCHEMVYVVELKPFHVVSVRLLDALGVKATRDLCHHKEILTRLPFTKPAVLDCLADTFFVAVTPSRVHEYVSSIKSFADRIVRHSIVVLPRSSPYKRHDNILSVNILSKGNCGHVCGRRTHRIPYHECKESPDVP